MNTLPLSCPDSNQRISLVAMQKKVRIPMAYLDNNPYLRMIRLNGLRWNVEGRGGEGQYLPLIPPPPLPNIFVRYHLCTDDDLLLSLPGRWLEGQRGLVEGAVKLAYSYQQSEQSNSKFGKKGLRGKMFGGPPPSPSSAFSILRSRTYSLIGRVQ